MNLATWSIRNPIPNILLFALLSLAGLVGFQRLQVQDFPELDLPTISVKLNLPGAAPAQLETDVAKKVEDKLATLPGLAHMSTSVTEGSVSISVQFTIETALAGALLDVKDAVDSVRGDLPTDLETPQVSKVTVGPGGPMLTYAVTSEHLDEEALSWFTDERIARTMLAVPGVGKMARIGGVQREVRVLVQPERMDALGVTVADVSQALRRTQQDASGGRGQWGGAEQGLRTVGAEHSTQALRELPVALTDGRSLRLDQVAQVRDTVAERTQAALLDGRAAVGFQISRSKGADEVNIEREVERSLTQLQLSTPGLKVQRVASTVEHTKEQYRGSMDMLYEGALLAVLVIWWYLRNWRATLIGAATLPLSILPTFAFMAWAGYALNTITLLALAVVVGILVDDAIVEVENIERHSAPGKPMRQATEEAVNDIWLAVLATTAALVVVFLPTSFMSGVPGLVFKQFGWTVVVSVLASLVVARLATPMMAAWLLREHAPVHSSGRVMKGYLALARWCLQHRAATLCASLLFFAGSLALVPLLPTTFIPPGDTGTTMVNMELPPGASLAQTVAVGEEARQVLANVPGVRSIFLAAGSAQAAGGPAPAAGEVRKGTLTVSLAARGERSGQQAIERDMRARLQQIPGMRWSISSGGPGEKLQLVLAGHDGQALKAAAAQLEQGLSGLPYLSGISSSASLERPEITFRPDGQAAAERGVSTQAIAETLRFATSGDYASALAKLPLDERQLDIRVRAPDALRQDPQALGALRVSGRQGGVPLNSVASIQLESGPAQINRFDRERNVTLSADLGGHALGAALADARALPASRALPPGVRLKESGDAELLVQLFAGFAFALATGVMCKYGVLVLLFKSWTQPFTILSALPMCVGGAFIALLVFGGHLSLPALIGLVMLFGVVTKNSILIIDCAISQQAQHGLDEMQALLVACERRARPVMMTTVAMVAGMLPMALGWGGDSSFRQPMAIAVIGGLITSTALSLVVVPVFSMTLSTWQRRLAALFGHHRQESTAASSIA